MNPTFILLDGPRVDIECETLYPEITITWLRAGGHDGMTVRGFATAEEMWAARRALPAGSRWAAYQWLIESWGQFASNPPYEIPAGPGRICRIFSRLSRASHLARLAQRYRLSLIEIQENDHLDAEAAKQKYEQLRRAEIEQEFDVQPDEQEKFQREFEVWLLNLYLFVSGPAGREETPPV